ncbi:MAG TPA: DUF4230 domain-containing protein, partial [Acidimicrobiales bacterium]|nr:DUF4230 domain-containing protein [Acidimicrobiales bacterium]
TDMARNNGDSGVTVVMPRPSRLRALGLAGLVLLAVLAGAGRLGDFLPSLPNPFSSETVDRSQPALLQSLADLSDYHAASGNFQVIIDTEEDTRFVPSFIRGERTVFVAGGSVDAVVDFSQLDERSIQVSPDRTSVSVALPAPTLAEPTVDADESRVVSRDRGVLDRIGSAFSDNPTSERPLILAAEEKMRAAANDSDLRKRAEENTRRMLEGMLGALGYTSVNVTFSPTPV